MKLRNCWTIRLLDYQPDGLSDLPCYRPELTDYWTNGLIGIDDYNRVLEYWANGLIGIDDYYRVLEYWTNGLIGIDDYNRVLEYWANGLTKFVLF